MRAITPRSRASPTAPLTPPNRAVPVGSSFTASGPGRARRRRAAGACVSASMTVSSAQAHLGSKPPNDRADPAPCGERVAVLGGRALLQGEIRHVELQGPDRVATPAVPVGM